METESDAFDDFSDFSNSNEEAEEEAAVCESEPKQPVPEYSSSELDELVVVVKKMIILSDLKESDWNAKSEEIIKTWFFDTNYTMLTIFFADTQLMASFSFPTVPVYDFMYFLRDPNHIFSIDCFHDDVTFGRINDDVDGILLTLMEKIYAPLIFRDIDTNNKSKAFFLKEIHEFLANMTALHYKLSGLTRLYVAIEGLCIDPDEAAQDFELVKRLELLAEHWISQLRICLNDTEQVAPFKLMCPADEYEFWIYRHEVLYVLRHETSHKDFLHLRHILRKSQSTFVKIIEELIEKSTNVMNEAENNIRFLKLLIKPCEEISMAESLLNVPIKLPQIINIIRYIWLNSEHYNGEHLITKLFRYVGNEIIRLCQKKIDVFNLLNNDSINGIKLANISIDCCIYYKVIYEKISAECRNSNGLEKWKLNKTMIFNYVETFIQRLHDFVEICEGIAIFGETNERRLVFGGDRGMEFKQTCHEIEIKFNQGLSKILQISHSILNIHDKKWHYEIKQYRAMTKDFEEIIENLITNVFSEINNVEEGVYALACLHRYSTRDKLRKAYDRKVNDVWQMFADEIKMTYKLSIDQLQEHLTYLPKCAGRAVHLKINRDRLIHIRALFEKAEWLPETTETEKILNDYKQMVSAINQKIQKLFDEWLQLLGIDVASKLNQPLLIRSISHPGLFECNINRTILETFDEANYFKMLGFGFPVHVSQFFSREISIKFTYDSIVDMIISYNKILIAISDAERLMFRPLIQICERCILPGVHKLTWANEGLDVYIAECNKQIRELREFLEIYRKVNERVVQSCEQICEVILVKISVTQPEKLENIEKALCDYRKQKILQIIEHLNNIVNMIFLVYNSLEPHMDSISNMWSKYISKFDKLIEEAMCVCARESLKSIYGTLHGNGIMVPSTLLYISVNIHDQKLTLTPKMQEIADLFGNISQLLLTSLSYVPRLHKRLHLKLTAVILPYHKVIETDLEYQQVQSTILFELKRNQREMFSYIEQWAPFAPIWQLDKDIFIEYFGSLENVPAEQFDKNIQQFNDISNQIAIRETTSIVNFMIIYAKKLRRFILMEIEDWQQRYLELLKQQTEEKITQFFNYTKENGDRVTEVPKTVEDLQRCCSFLAQLLTNVGHWKRVVDILNSNINILQKYDVFIGGEFREMKLTMAQQWNDYMKKLADADEMLENAQESFKLILQSSKLRREMPE